MQSRYYKPEVGRFLNADVFASTSQGLLGNNMFAYCGNNAVNHFDPSGQYMAAIDFGFSGGGIGITSGTSGGGARATSQDVSRNANNQSSAFSTGKRDANELWQEIKKVYRDMTSFADAYPVVKIYEGVKDTKDGVNTFINGVSLLYAPVPTGIEDVIGVGLCAWGVLQIAGGFVKTLVGFDEF